MSRRRSRNKWKIWFNLNLLYFCKNVTLGGVCVASSGRGERERTYDLVMRQEWPSTGLHYPDMPVVHWEWPNTHIGNRNIHTHTQRHTLPQGPHTHTISRGESAVVLADKLKIATIARSTHTHTHSSTQPPYNKLPGSSGGRSALSSMEEELVNLQTLRWFESVKCQRDDDDVTVHVLVHYRTRRVHIEQVQSSYLIRAGGAFRQYQLQWLSSSVTDSGLFKITRTSEYVVSFRK